MKLIPTSKRIKGMRCWFCRTDKSVKYEAKMVNTRPLADNRYMHILVCTKCAIHHKLDFIEEASK